MERCASDRRRDVPQRDAAEHGERRERRPPADRRAVVPAQRGRRIRRADAARAHADRALAPHGAAVPGRREHDVDPGVGPLRPRRALRDKRVRQEDDVARDRAQRCEQVVLVVDDRRIPDAGRPALGVAVDDDGFLTDAEGSGGLPPEFAILSVFRRDG
ncbi:conserved hypothetical protein [Burkholderia cenocepacia]|nr:conserved hypothetical protein [Burkholderia cenocepacia]